MKVRFHVPVRGCVSLLNSIEEVFRANVTIERDSTDDDAPPALIASVPTEFESTFTEWAQVSGFALSEVE